MSHRTPVLDKSGHLSGTDRTDTPLSLERVSGPGVRSSETVSGSQRLLDVKNAARYLSVSEWTVRDWAAQGLFPVVELPSRRPREGERPRRAFRRLLIDVQELDRFIEARQRRLSK